MTEPQVHTGGCLCGQVQYAVGGQMRDIIYCHCEQCRRTSGHHVAASAALAADLVLTESAGLNWYRSSDSAERGFCYLCGSNLFWRRLKGHYVSIMAGTLDGPTGLAACEHIFTEAAGDYYSIDDELPRFEGRNPKRSYD